MRGVPKPARSASLAPQMRVQVVRAGTDRVGRERSRRRSDGRLCEQALRRSALSRESPLHE